MKADPDFVAGWLESENSLELDYLAKTFGIDLDRFIYIDHTREVAGEGALDIAESLIGANALDIFVINSLKALVPSEEFEKDMSRVQVGSQARMNAKMVRKFTPVVKEADLAFVIVTHLTTDIGTMYGDPLKIAGGNAIAYHSMLTLDLRKRAVLDSDPINRDEGIKVGVSVKKNHCVPDRNPYVKVDYYAIFGEGIEQILTTMEKAKEQGILIQAGAWIREPNIENIKDARMHPEYGELKWNGKAAFRQFCLDNPGYFEELKSKVVSYKNMTPEEIEQLEKDELEIAQDVEKELKSKSKKKK